MRFMRRSAAPALFIMLARAAASQAAAAVHPEHEVGALVRARAVASRAPTEVVVGSREGGEHEGAEWWERHDSLFRQARAEWGQKHAELYDFAAHEEDFVDPALLALVRAAEADAASGLPVDERELKAHLRPTNMAGVYRLRLLTPRFCEMLLEELHHLAASGVPTRRPNGMNRFGAILENVPGGLSIETLVGRIAHRYGRPLAQMTFPQLVGAADADKHFGFVVKYRLGEDESLALHADASVATLNVPLNVGRFDGGGLCFRGTRMVDEKPKKMLATCVSWDGFSPGEAILHLGMSMAQRLCA